MSDSDNVDSFLSSLAATYNVPAPIVEIEKAKPKQKAKATPSNNGTIPVSNAPKAKGPVLELPPKGSLNHVEFLKALVRARSREDQIKALAGYVGYDPRELLGIQESRAKMAAQKAIRGVDTSDSGRVAQTVRGYVAGMPDLRSKRYADLQGRLNAAIDAEKDHMALASGALSEIERDYQSKLAQLERERIIAIQKDLKNEFGH